MSSQKELIPMRPGDILRSEREQKGLSLERASRESRIRPSVLEAIESGQTSHIPSVYLKGYIRNYARYLGLETEEIEECLHEAEGAEPEVKSVFTSGPARSRSEQWIKVTSYLAASVLIGALAWQFTGEAVRFSQGESSLTTADAAATDDVPGQESTAEKQANARTHLNASIASVEVLQQRNGANARHAAEDAWAAIDDPVLPGEMHTLALTTSADTWVEIIGADDEQLELDLIRGGSSREYRDPGPFRVTIGRASAVQVVLDGEAVDLAPYTREDVANLNLAQAAPDVEDQSETPENH